jgi:HAMP domain-containing protein
MASLSIRKTIPLLIVTPLVVAIAVIGSLSIYYGRRSVNQLSEDLMQSTANRIQDQVKGMMAEPMLINRINGSAIATGELNLAEWRQWGGYFDSQLQATKNTNYIYAGTEQGYFVGARIQQGQRFVVRSDETTPGRTYQYDVDESGRISSEVSREFEYDPRTRPWYEAAVTARQSIWSDVYVGFTTRELLITAAYPIHGDRGELVGVLGTDMFVSEMNRFLDDLEVGKTGEVFIVEQDGQLVASSIGDTIRVEPAGNEGDAEISRVSAFDTEETLIADAVSHLLDEYGDLSLIQTNRRINRRIGNQSTFITARPLRDDMGLEWLIVVVVPTQDFAGPLRTQTLSILLFSSVAIAGAIGLGWLVARWITAPILQLHTVATHVKSQQYDPNSVDYLTQREDEIGQFAQVFSEMAEVISQREESLEEQLTYMRLRAPLPDVRRSLDLSELRALQQKAKIIRETQHL